MNHRLALNDDEWRIVADVLEQERKELHAVIHHAGRITHEALHARLQAVERLLQRMRATAGVRGSA